MTTTSNDPSLQELADLVQERLPLELRNYVYSYLWDDEVLNALNYASQVESTGSCQKRDLDGSGDAVCVCDLDETIPLFARAVSVGSSFAHEAVLWLYENSTQFLIRETSMIGKFLNVDVFHLNLTPSTTRLRRLNIEISLFGVPFTRRPWKTLTGDLFQLFNSEHHSAFELRIAFVTVATDAQGTNIFLLSQYMEYLKPIIARLRGKMKVTVLLCYTGHDAPRIDIEHMLGRHTADKWASFVHGILLCWRRRCQYNTEQNSQQTI